MREIAIIKFLLDMPIWQGNIFCNHFRFRKFYYDSDDKECLEFTFGGCEGNGNRFSSIKECELVCLSREEPEVAQQSTISKVSCIDFCPHTVLKLLIHLNPKFMGQTFY